MSEFPDDHYLLTFAEVQSVMFALLRTTVDVDPPGHQGANRAGDRAAQLGTNRDVEAIALFVRECD